MAKILEYLWSVTWGWTWILLLEADRRGGFNFCFVGFFCKHVDGILKLECSW